MVVDGVYEITMQTLMGKHRGKLTLKTSGNVLTGTNETPIGTTSFTGTVEDDRVQWTERLETPMGSVTITCKVEGDKILGQVIPRLVMYPSRASERAVNIRNGKFASCFLKR